MARRMLWRLRAAHGGFTIVELLVIVVIISLLAAAAIVALLRARIVTSERLALATMRNVRQALEMYSLVRQMYPSDLTYLGVPYSTPPFLPPDQIGSGIVFTRQGYIFDYIAPVGPTYTMHANPQQHNITGERHFITDNSNVVYSTTQNRDALVTDPVAQ